MIILLLAICTAYTPAPCIVGQLTSSEPMHQVAHDYCTIDTLWKQTGLQRPAQVMATLHNATRCCSSTTCHVPEWVQKSACKYTQLRGSVSECFPEQATNHITTCKAVNAFVQDRTKMCNCGLLPECRTANLECVYGAQLLQQVQYHKDRCTNTQAAQLVLNHTWAPTVNNVSAALNAFDNCLQTLQPQQHVPSVSQAYAVFRAAEEATARTAERTLRVACMLLLEVDISTIKLKDMINRWQLKYCASFVFN